MHKINWMKIAPFFVLFGVVVLLYKALSLNPNELPLERQGEPLPAFSLPNLYHLDETITKENIPNQPLLVHVWATWCGICRNEHPVLLELKNKGVPIVGINYRDEPEYAVSWLNKQGDPYIKNIADIHGTFGIELGVFGTPETYLIDKEGKLRYRHVGILKDKDDIKSLLSALKALESESA